MLVWHLPEGRWVLLYLSSVTCYWVLKSLSIRLSGLYEHYAADTEHPQYYRLFFILNGSVFFRWLSNQDCQIKKHVSNSSSLVVIWYTGQFLHLKNKQNYMTTIVSLLKMFSAGGRRKDIMVFFFTFYFLHSSSLFIFFTCDDRRQTTRLGTCDRCHVCLPQSQQWFFASITNQNLPGSSLVTNGFR